MFKYIAVTFNSRFKGIRLQYLENIEAQNRWFLLKITTGHKRNAIDGL